MMTPRPLLAAPLLLLLTLAPAAPAQTVFRWNNTLSDWGNAAAWTPGGGPPGAGDIAAFDPRAGSGPLDVNPTLGADRTVLALSFNNNHLGDDFSLNGGGAGNDLTLFAAGSNPAALGGLPAVLTVRGYRAPLPTFEFTTPVPADFSFRNAGTLRLGTASTTNGVAVGLDIGHGTGFSLTGASVRLDRSAGTVLVRGGELAVDDRRGQDNGTGQAATFATAGDIFLNGGQSALRFSASQDPGADSDFDVQPDFAGSRGRLVLAAGGATVQLQSFTGAPVLRFGSLVLGNAAATVDFRLNSVGATGPAIRFNTAPALTNGVLTAGVPGSPEVGWATLNGFDFATYDNASDRIAPALAAFVVSGATLSNPTQPATANLEIEGEAVVAAGETFAANTVKFSNAFGFTNVLTIPADSAVQTSGLLLPAGGPGYVIDGGTLTGAAPRYVHVFATVTPGNGPNSAQLDVSSAFDLPASVIDRPAVFSLIKTGPGLLRFTGVADQVNFIGAGNTAVAIADGALQGRIGTTINAVPPNFGPNNQLQLRGGVFEVDSGDVAGNASLFDRPLGAGAGQVNWSSPTPNVLGALASAGSGGFSAVGGQLNVSLTVNNVPNGALIWDVTPHFLRDGHALLFGAASSTALVEWRNPVALDDGAANRPNNAREISVYGDLLSVGDGQLQLFQTDARMTGALTGTAHTDLLKTGLGVLELAAANPFTGRTLVRGGTLALSGGGGGALANTAALIVNGRGTVINDAPVTTLQLLADNQVNDAAPVRLRNGVILAADTDGHGRAETFGALTLTNRDNVFSALSLGLADADNDPDGTVIRFAGSSANSWIGELRIENWSGDPDNGNGFDQVYFGTTDGGLTSAQLAAISFYDDTGTFLGLARFAPDLDGEIIPVPVPEPGTWAAGACALVALAYGRRRRKILG